MSILHSIGIPTAKVELDSTFNGLGKHSQFELVLMMVTVMQTIHCLPVPYFHMGHTLVLHGLICYRDYIGHCSFYHRFNWSPNVNDSTSLLLSI